MKTTLTFNHKFKKGDTVYVRVSQYINTTCDKCMSTRFAGEKEEKVFKVKIKKVSFGTYGGDKSTAYSLSDPVAVYNINEKYLSKTEAEALKNKNVWPRG